MKEFNRIYKVFTVLPDENDRSDDIVIFGRASNVQMAKEAIECFVTQRERVKFLLNYFPSLKHLCRAIMLDHQ